MFPFKLEMGEYSVWGFPRLGNLSNLRAGVVGSRSLLLTIGIPSLIMTWTIHIVPGMVPGWFVVVGQPWEVPGKGVQGSECMTGHWLVSPAFGHQKKIGTHYILGSNPLRTLINIDLSTLDYVNSLVVASNVIPVNMLLIFLHLMAICNLDLTVKCTKKSNIPPNSLTGHIYAHHAWIPARF